MTSEPEDREKWKYHNGTCCTKCGRPVSNKNWLMPEGITEILCWVCSDEKKELKSDD